MFFWRDNRRTANRRRGKKSGRLLFSS
jgi:hypothetical protein